MKKPIRRMRKKSLEELQIPAYCTEPAPPSPTSPDAPGGAAAGVGVEPDGAKSALNKTPERIEYCTESEVEESEFDQTAHNLSALHGEGDDSE